MPTYDTCTFKTAEAPTTTLHSHSHLSATFSITNPPTAPSSLLHYSPTIKSCNPLVIPSSVQTSSSLSSPTTKKMPFVSHSWASASFLDAEVIAPIDADPFFENRGLLQLHQLTAAVTAQRQQEFKKLGSSPLKSELRVRLDPMDEDEMVSDQDSDDEDEDIGVNVDGDCDGDSACEIVDAEKKDGDNSPDAGGAGTEGAEGVLSMGTVSTAYKPLSEGGDRTRDCSKDEELGIDKLAQRISELKLFGTCTSSNINSIARNINDIAINAMNRVPFPDLENGHYGPPPSPSVRPCAEDTSVATTTSSKSASTDSAQSAGKNGVTVKGSLVIIKIPNNRASVVMPEKFSSVTVIMPAPAPAATADHPEVEEGGEVGQKRNSESLKNAEETSSSKKRR
ncbi:hypothetical protein BG015_008555 [Linnemannia schmuckeri]|uniref:Uncharacterized protein n=1 Tax=Linnemannia schmuckeri TaxID=64567 RepID=A0A9P5RWT3_9FUNG|nr:hypothetical protein BG015_008555 [Linnemannia schmuckeri]